MGNNLMTFFLRLSSNALLNKHRNTSQKQRSALTGGCKWDLRVDLDWQLRFPSEITTTNLRPDIILCSTTAWAAITTELTVPWEAGMEAAYERKKSLDLTAEYERSRVVSCQLPC